MHLLTVPALLLPRRSLRIAAALACRSRGWVRHAPDRLLHGRRRAAALARARAQPLPATLLFVCEGNIYRSPYAAGAFVGALAPSLRAAVGVSSAGFVGPGRPSPEAAVRAAALRGVDLAAHRASLVTGAHVHAASLVVVMDARQREAIRARFGACAADVLVLGDFDPEPVETRGVRDPWREDADVLEASYARVDRCVAALARAMAEGTRVSAWGT